MIRIEPDKIIYENHRGEKEEINIIDLPFYLSEAIEIADDVTFKRIFEIVIMNRTIFDIIFAGSTGRYPLHYYIDEFVKDDNDDDPDSITYLVVEHAAEVWDFDDITEVSHYHSFHGIREQYTDEFQKEPCDMGISLMMSPIHNLKKYKIRVNNKVKYTKHDTKAKKIVTLVEGDQTINVFEFYSAILHEISWFGTPEERDEKSNELKETSEALERGEIETYEMKWDEDDEPYLIKDGKKEYLFKDKS